MSHEKSEVRTQVRNNFNSEQDPTGKHKVGYNLNMMGWKKIDITEHQELDISKF